MYFSDLSQINAIASRVDSTTIALPPHHIADFTIKNAFTVTPDLTKSTPVITIEQIRDLLALLSTRQTSAKFCLLKHAELMTEAAANALLKNLEEPTVNFHFLLLTPDPSQLLPTIRSRTQIYRYHNPVDQPAPDPVSLDYAKKLITTTGSNLVDIADTLSKKPKKSSTKSANNSAAASPRALALTATTAAIQLLEKSYLKTANPKLLRRLRQLVDLHSALAAGGHIKLQVIACLC